MYSFYFLVTYNVSLCPELTEVGQKCSSQPLMIVVVVVLSGKS